LRSQNQNLEKHISSNWGNGSWAMVTSWNVERSGAQVSFPKYLVNDTVNDKNVITVLAVPVADKLRRAVWKSVWHKAGILFELYIETTLNAPLTVEFDYSSVVKTLKVTSRPCKTPQTRMNTSFFM
jgi:hypothetical protein